MQQVTADLYGIFLVIFTSPFGTETITGIQARGSYNAPHRFLRYRGGNTYWPLVPDVKRPSEYRFPRITFDNTKGKLGVSNNLKRDENDGQLHPWRRPFPNTPVPEKLSPVPITTLGPLYNIVLESVLWVTIEQPVKKSTSENLDVNEPSEATSYFGPSEVTAASKASQGSYRSNVDYFQISLKDIERIAIERQIDISSACSPIIERSEGKELPAW